MDKKTVDILQEEDTKMNGHLGKSLNDKKEEVVVNPASGLTERVNKMIEDEVAKIAKEQAGKPQQVEVINPKLPDIIVPRAEIIQDVTNVFKTIQTTLIETIKAHATKLPGMFKVSGQVDALIGNFPKVQKVEGDVAATLNKGQVETLVELLKELKGVKVENLPIGTSDVEPNSKTNNPSKWLNVRFTNGREYYDFFQTVISAQSKLFAVFEQLLAQQSNQAAMNATIAESASLSGAINLGVKKIVAIHMPAAWTTANLTFQAAPTVDGTYRDIYDSAGNEFSVVAAASRVLTDIPELAPFKFVRIRSGTTGTPVAQDAARTLSLELSN